MANEQQTPEQGDVFVEIVQVNTYRVRCVKCNAIATLNAMNRLQIIEQMADMHCPKCSKFWFKEGSHSGLVQAPGMPGPVQLPGTPKGPAGLKIVKQ